MTKKKEKLFDVLIYEIKSMQIDAVAGEALPYASGRFLLISLLMKKLSTKRLQIVSDRINDNYSAAIVPTGKYKKGDVLKNKDIR